MMECCDDEEEEEEREKSGRWQAYIAILEVW